MAAHLTHHIPSQIFQVLRKTACYPSAKLYARIGRLQVSLLPLTQCRGHYLRRFSTSGHNLTRTAGSTTTPSQPLKHQDVKTQIIFNISQQLTSVTTDSLLYRTEAFHRVLDCMFKYRFSEAEIVDMFVSSPELLSFDGSVVEKSIRFLRDEGFSTRQVNMLLKQSTDIVGAEDQMSRVLDFLRQEAKLSESHLQDVLSTNLELLLSSPEQLTGNYAMLMGLFRRSDIKRMMHHDPLILLQTDVEVEEKVNYVYHTMAQDQVEMVWANILSHDIEHIRARHQLLARVGKFEKPDKKGVTKNPNPLLKDIMNISDKQFVKLAGVTIEEFEVFKKLLEVERENKLEEFRSEALNLEAEEDFDNLEDDREQDGYKGEKVKKARMRKKIILD